MARYLIRQVGVRGLVVLLVVVLAWFMQFVVPNDPARQIAPRARGEALEAIREDLGLNEPLWQQFVSYFGGLLHGDLGTSYVKQRPVSSLIMERLPATLTLALAVTILQVLIGGSLGILAAFRRKAGKVVTGTNVILFAIPEFTLALFMVLVFVLWLDVLPYGGFGLPQLILPAVTLGLVYAPWYAQIIREQMDESLSSPYVRTALAKGVSDRRIIRRHTMRNVIPPILTLAALDFAGLLSGVGIIEQVFGWPGIGQLTISSALGGDRPVVMGMVLFGTLMVVMFNLVVDIVQVYVDPRTRVGLVE